MHRRSKNEREKKNYGCFCSYYFNCVVSVHVCTFVRACIWYSILRYMFAYKCIGSLTVPGNVYSILKVKMEVLKLNNKNVVRKRFWKFECVCVV